MRRTKSVIPNIFTTLNIFFGFLAIVNIIEDKYITGCWLISLAAVFDVLDGQMARLTKTSSDFGIEFDSLADVVSFGAAPSVLLYKTYLFDNGILGVIISFMPLLFGGIRLARFNVLFGGKEKAKFIGLPIPFAALHTAAFIIFNYRFWDGLHLSRILIPQIFFTSILMVSTVEYYTLPKFSLKHSTRNTIRIFTILIMLVVMALFPREAFYPISSAYILWGVFRFIFSQAKGNSSGKPAEIIA